MDPEELQLFLILLLIAASEGDKEEDKETCTR